jgi:hypothetical protein
LPHSFENAFPHVEVRYHPAVLHGAGVPPGPRPSATTRNVMMRVLLRALGRPLVTALHQSDGASPDGSLRQ